MEGTPYKIHDDIELISEINVIINKVRHWEGGRGRSNRYEILPALFLTLPREGRQDYYFNDFVWKQKCESVILMVGGTGIKALNLINIGVFNPAGVRALMQSPQVDLVVYLRAAR